MNHLNSHRQLWLVVLISIALHASFGVLAQASTSDSAVGSLYYADETPLPSGARDQTTREEYANPEITLAVAAIECDKRLASSNPLQQEHENDCRNELADTIVERNHLLQESKSLKNKIERMERDYLNVLNETWTEVELLEDKVKRQTRTLNSKEDRVIDTRKRMLKLDAELRQMHAAARNQYLNFTLIREDAFGFIALRVNKQWTHHHRRLKPRILDATRRYNRFCRETKQKKMSLKRKWTRSCWAHRIEVSWATITRPVHAMYMHIEPTIEEAKMASRLSISSLIKETSKLALVHLEKEEKLKQDNQERDLKRRIDRIHRRNEKLNTHDDTTNKDTKPSPLNMKVRTFFRYASRNAELLCDKGMVFMPLAVALSATRTGSVGILSLLCGVPTPFIWIIVIVRVIMMPRLKRCNLLQ